MVVLQLWELIMTQIGSIGLHLLISLHSQWITIRGEMVVSGQGGAQKTSVTHEVSDLEIFPTEKSSINVLFSFEFIEYFFHLILFATQETIFSVFNIGTLPNQVSSFHAVPQKKLLAESPDLGLSLLLHAEWSWTRLFHLWVPISSSVKGLTT